MKRNSNRGVNRVIASSGVLLAALAALATVPQSAEAQYGQGRYNRQERGNRQNRQNDQNTYGRITFDWDLNGFTVRDRAGLEAQIRRDLNADAGSRSVGRRGGSEGTLEVNVKFSRENSNRVKAEVRLGLNRDGRGPAGVTATESASVQSRDKNVDGQVVLQAFRKARREFTAKVNQDNRNR